MARRSFEVVTYTFCLERLGYLHCLFTLSRFISQLPLHAVGARVLCDNIPGLIGRQRKLCHAHPDVMISLGEGAKLGIKECQYRFSNQRWNCSTLDRDASVFGKIILKGEHHYEEISPNINQGI